MLKSDLYIALCILIGLCCMSSSCRQPQIHTLETIGFLEKLDNRFEEIVSSSAKIEVLSSNHNWTEGPVWIPQKKWLLFSDVPENKIFKWEATDTVTTFLEPSGYSGNIKNRPGSNGLTLDLDGNLILCKSGDRKIDRLLNLDDLPHPKFETLADQYDGKRFNSPNDIVTDKQGNFYFTDPNFGLKEEDKEMDYCGVFKISKDGEIHLLTKTCPTPNGIGISPDQKTLYVANSRPPLLYAWDIGSDHQLQNERVLFDVGDLWKNSISKQPPDGMAINADGIIFMTGPDGVLIFTPKGEHLGTIKTDKLTSNCTLNEDETVLYISCDDLVLRVRLT